MGSTAIPNGTFTVARRGRRATYRIRTQPREASFAPGRRVASLLSGPNNSEDYTPFAFLSAAGTEVRVWKRYRESEYVRHANLIRLVLGEKRGDELGYSIDAAATCTRCNRALTVPDSIHAGMGPVCAQKGA